MTRHALALFAIAIWMTGCGGMRPQPAFINETPQSETFLWQQWKAAQQQIATAPGVDLTRIRTIFEHTPPAFVVDPRALAIAPHNLLVESIPDQRPGQIACPQPCDVAYSDAYSCFSPSDPRVVYAASWNLKPADLAAWLEYEFASQILYQLGYTTSWR